MNHIIAIIMDSTHLPFESAKFETLNDHNYFQWKYHMEMQLVWKDLWDIVSGETVHPDGPETARAVKNWNKQNHLAATKIIMHVSNSQLSHTCKMTNAQEMWDILHHVHDVGRTILYNV